MISPFDVRDPVTWLPLWFLCFSPYFREWGQPGEKLLRNLSCCFPPGRCSLMRQLSKLRQSAQGSLVGSTGLPCGLEWMIITSGLVRMVIPSGLVWMVIQFGLVRMVILVCIVITSELVRMVIPSELVCMVFTSGLLWMVITSGLIWMPISPSDSSGMFFSNISWNTHHKDLCSPPPLGSFLLYFQPEKVLWFFLYLQDKWYMASIHDSPLSPSYYYEGVSKTQYPLRVTQTFLKHFLWLSFLECGNPGRKQDFILVSVLLKAPFTTTATVLHGTDMQVMDRGGMVSQRKDQ